jgi:hypothetical protein
VQTAWKRAGLALVLVGAIAVSHARLPDAPASAGGEAFVPEPWLAELAAFGFEALVSDYHWLAAVQIVGSLEGPVGRNRLIGRLIDVVTALVPWVDHPYRFAAVWMIDDEPAVRHANAILERGIAHHPDEWRNRFYLGFNRFFFLGEHAAAADAIESALGLPGAPRYLPRLVARLRHESGGDLDAAAGFLAELVRQTPDERLRAEYEIALAEIETERRARMLDQARETFRERHGRDIASVEDLVRVSPRVLRALPPEPNGGHWTLDPESGRIVSSQVKRRYAINIDALNRQLLERFKERSRQADEARAQGRQGQG